MVEINEPLLMLNFVGLYVLLIASSVHNFYQSKKMYSLVETMGDVVAHLGEIRETRPKQQPRAEPPKEGTVKRLLREGMELEGREE